MSLKVYRLRSANYSLGAAQYHQASVVKRVDGWVLRHFELSQKGRINVVKIQVVYASGETKTLDLPAGSTWHVEDIDNATMNRFYSDHGFDHWFNADGSYDGGGFVNCPQPDQSNTQINDSQGDVHRCIVAEGREA